MKIGNILVAAAVFVSACCSAFAQEAEKPKSLEERCEDEADRLQASLQLEDWQVYYVDSILKHDYAALEKQYEEMQRAKVTNYNMYQERQDRCLDRIDIAYKKIFTDEQWALYQKQGAAKAQKARDKRREKAQATVKKKK